MHLCAWLKTKLGTDMWVVARKSMRLVDQGYTVFLSQKRWNQLVEEYTKETGKHPWEKPSA
jgi:hypothetical protein